MCVCVNLKWVYLGLGGIMIKPQGLGIRLEEWPMVNSICGTWEDMWLYVRR